MALQGNCWLLSRAITTKEIHLMHAHAPMAAATVQSSIGKLSKNVPDLQAGWPGLQQGQHARPSRNWAVCPPSDWKKKKGTRVWTAAVGCVGHPDSTAAADRGQVHACSRALRGRAQPCATRLSSTGPSKQSLTHTVACSVRSKPPSAQCSPSQHTLRPSSPHCLDCQGRVNPPRPPLPPPPCPCLLFGTRNRC